MSSSFNVFGVLLASEELVFNFQRLKKAFKEVAYITLENSVLTGYPKIKLKEAIHKNYSGCKLLVVSYRVIVNNSKELNFKK